MITDDLLREYIEALLPQTMPKVTVTVVSEDFLEVVVERMPSEMRTVTDSVTVIVTKAQPFRDRFIHHHKGRRPKRGNPWSRA